MNIVLWILQVLLAAHTAIGAVWKFFHGPQTVPALSAIPPGVWFAMAVVELLCSFGLVLPALYRPAGGVVPVAAAVVALEMLVFTGLQVSSSHPNYEHVIYWLSVAVICGLIALGRVIVRPIKSKAEQMTPS